MVKNDELNWWIRVLNEGYKLHTGIEISYKDCKEIAEYLKKLDQKNKQFQKKIDELNLYRKLSFNSAMSNLVGMINNFEKVDVVDLKRLFSQLKSFENNLEKILKGEK